MAGGQTTKQNPSDANIANGNVPNLSNSKIISILIILLKMKTGNDVFVAVCFRRPCPMIMTMMSKNSFEMKRTMDFIILMIFYEHDSIKNVNKNINFHTQSINTAHGCEWERKSDRESDFVEICQKIVSDKLTDPEPNSWVQITVLQYVKCQSIVLWQFYSIPECKKCCDLNLNLQFWASLDRSEMLRKNRELGVIHTEPRSGKNSEQFFPPGFMTIPTWK